MGPEGVAWNPGLIRAIRGSIEHCAAASRPCIQVFHPSPGNRWVPPSESWGVFPASFNPPTEAHAAILASAMEEANLRGVLLLLDLRHADKPDQDATMVDRALMMVARFSGDPRMALGICSHGRFLDKADAIQRDLDPKAPWWFLVGADTLERVLDPRFYEAPERELGDLFGRAGFSVFSRGEMAADVRAKMEFWRQRGARIVTRDLPHWAGTISSSMVRARMSLGQDPGTGLDPSIARFIEETGVYLPATPRGSRYEDRKQWLDSVSGEKPS